MDAFKMSAGAVGLLLLTSLAIVGCEGDEGPVGPAGDIADITCAQCHNDSNLISGKQVQWAESAHGTGEAYVRGTRSSCAGCHSGNSFAVRLAAGLDPDELTEGDPNPTRQDCRACHQIHETYSLDDFALRGDDAAVAFYAVDGATYDGGHGNLCANCHQPRRVIAEAVDGVISGISSHWGPHHGGQGSMILGVAGAGDVTGSPHPHYSLVEETCVGCHMGEGRDHRMEPDTDNCEACHGEIEDFDVNGVQSQVKTLLTALGDRLVDLGLINENTEDGHPIVTEAPEAQAIAMWNWIYVAHEDKSLGVHNAAYTIDLLEESLSLLR